ncbi:MAG TPA: hypothetical protein VLE02_05140 [Nitrosarchaeum sp.]|nr:hypothetical protein [Nitrosarchaeum sp.]
MDEIKFKKQAEEEQKLFKDAVKRSYEFLSSNDEYEEGRIVMGLMQTLLDSIEEYQDDVNKEMVDLLSGTTKVMNCEDEK